MDNFVTTQSRRSGASYALNREKRFMTLLHPELQAALLTEGEKREDYYGKKADYWKRHGLLDGTDVRYDGKLTSERVQTTLANIQQVVFEVTDACNLKCKYCGYGEYYQGFDVRKHQRMSVESARQVVDYLKELWNSNRCTSTGDLVFFSFYGGEPLLNVPFIESMIQYIEQAGITNKNIQYSMTTNAVLLDKYAAFLAEHAFHLLISLDGNAYHDSYRVTKEGKESFPKVFENIAYLKERYPDYFEKYVNFNAVLHNRNSVDETYRFIYDTYGKVPTISELNLSGIRPDKQQEFFTLYKNKTESLSKSENRADLEKALFVKSSSYYDCALFLNQFSPGVMKSYQDFFVRYKKKSYIPTGTCLPFSRKMFITVNGKVLPCERIGQEHALGKVSEKGVELDPEFVANEHNSLLDKLRNQCQVCYRASHCIQCVHNVDTIDEAKVVCPAFMSKKDFERTLEKEMRFLEEHRDEYEKIMNVFLE